VTFSRILALCAVAWALAPSAASATWSIVAVDPETGDVGGAIASCVDLPSRYYDDDGVLTLFALVPGVGAGVSQAEINLRAPPRIVSDLEAGRSAAETIEDLTGDFDAEPEVRQHAVVRLDDPAAPAAFTGRETLAWSGHETARGVSVQGNILVAADVVADSLAAYLAAGDAPLSDRLVQGLLAGGREGGDSRCSAEQSALFAQVTVRGSDGALTTRTVRVEEGDGSNPVELLAAGQTSDPPEPGYGGAVVAVVLLVLVVGAGVGIALIVRRRRASRRS
jgi:uncharacterized Ntn-hydrolase superfamily protein